MINPFDGDRLLIMRSRFIDRIDQARRYLAVANTPPPPLTTEMTVSTVAAAHWSTTASEYFSTKRRSVKFVLTFVYKHLSLVNFLLCADR